MEIASRLAQDICEAIKVGAGKIKEVREQGISSDWESNLTFTHEKLGIKVKVTVDVSLIENRDTEG